MLDDENTPSFIFALNTAIITCCDEYSANNIQAIAALGHIFALASVSSGMDLNIFDASLIIIRESFKQAWEERNKNV